METPKKYRNRIVVLGVIFLCYTMFQIWFFSQEVGEREFYSRLESQISNPLLLNSGLVEAQKAEVRVVLWFEQGKPDRGFKQDLPQTGWAWMESNSAGIAELPYSLAGYRTIVTEEEPEIFAWYQDLEQEVSEVGGIAYLDERIPEGIDIAHYALKQNILPRQFSLSERTISVTGWQESLFSQVLAGDDRVNIQIISQTHGGKGRTALALPVLLEEF
ncbi:MAG: hypothetical protein AB7E31_02635 [Desulfitobacterium sp.]